MDKRITFIGGGNMGRAMIGGLIADGYAPNLIRAADPAGAAAQTLATDFGIAVTADNNDAVDGADVVVLAVKPQIMRDIAREIAPALSTAQPLVLSIAAGITTTHLQGWLGAKTPVVRVMPNTPALVRCGAAGLYAGPTVSNEQRALAQTVVGAVGLALWVDKESDIDTVTALSGSGPAYFFLILELLEAAAVELGLTTDTARALALQTAWGATQLARELGSDPATLRRQVTSPGGTTERALQALEDGGLAELLKTALAAAHQRSRELAGQFGGKLMAGGYLTNAGVFLVDAVFSLYILAVLLRLVLQIVRADFYNPISQAIVTVTNPPLRPMRRYIPALGGIDTASVVLLIVLQMINTWLVTAMLGYSARIPGILVTALAELISKTIYVFIFAIVIQVVISWVSPGAYNPITALLDTITQPLMRPARRRMPALGGLDFSPLVVIVVLQLMLLLVVAPVRDLGRMML